jgi:hypothetical protein
VKFPHSQQTWTRFEIVEALIDDGQQLRDENYLSVNILRSFAERVLLFLPSPLSPLLFDDSSTQVFADREEPPRKARPYTLEQQKRRASMALVIQNAWFNYLVREAERFEQKQCC